MVETQQPIRILLAEDSSPDAYLFEEALRRNGMTVEIDHCCDGEQCIRKIASYPPTKPPDLCVIDLHLPHVDGLKLLETIRANPSFARTPLMVLTSSCSAKDRNVCLDLGANAFISKPTNFDDFINVIAVTVRSVLLGEDARRRSAAIIESSEDAIISKSVEGIVQSWNAGAERIYGYAAEEMIGRPMTVLLPSEHRDEETESLGRLRQGESVHHFETVRVRKNKEQIFVSVTISPIKNKDGEMTGISHIARDISDQKVLERQRQSQRLESLGLLAGGIAHDFNNLLTGILGNASLLSEALADSDPSQQYLQDLMKSAEKAAELTMQLLAYAGKGRFVIAPLDLSALVTDINKLIGASIPKTVSVRMELDKNLPAIEGDRNQLQQLVMNLIINGAEAIGQECGAVTVRTGTHQIDDIDLGVGIDGTIISPGLYVYLEVRDDGCGMDPVTSAKIFEPFFTTKFTGRGLGLSAALGIVKAHNGAIRLYTTPGLGSTFKIFFPLMSSRDKESEPKQQRGVVLVVDDEETIRRVAKSALETYGYRVLTAVNGRDAIELFRDRPRSINAIVLDLTMPVMSGKEALPVLRAIRSDVPIVLVSGYSENEMRPLFSGDRLVGFLQKPFTTKQLRAIIEEATAYAGSHITPLG
jgi:PAS domain S-box-containing protein